MCVHVHMYAGCTRMVCGGQKWTSGVSLSYSHIGYFTWGSPGNYTGCPDSARDLPVSAPSVLGFQVGVAVPSIYKGAGDVNSDPPHACVANTFLTEPFL